MHFRDVWVLFRMPGPGSLRGMEADERSAIGPDIATWLEQTARHVVDAQLAEAARLDTRARELLGFVGVVLALLAAAASRGGAVAGLEGALFYVGSLVSAVLLVWAGVSAAMRVVAPGDYAAPGQAALAVLHDAPVAPWVSLAQIQVDTFFDLLAAARRNARVLARGRSRLARAYLVFAMALGFAGLAVVAVVLSPA